MEQPKTLEAVDVFLNPPAIQTHGQLLCTPDKAQIFNIVNRALLAIQILGQYQFNQQNEDFQNLHTILRSYGLNTETNRFDPEIYASSFVRMRGPRVKPAQLLELGNAYFVVGTGGNYPEKVAGACGYLQRLGCPVEPLGNSRLVNLAPGSAPSPGSVRSKVPDNLACTDTAAVAADVDYAILQDNARGCVVTGHNSRGC